MGVGFKALSFCTLLSALSYAADRRDLRLVDAVKMGDKEAMRSLLKQHLDVNVRQADGATALAWAAYLDDLETAEVLIRAGAKVDAGNDYGVTPLSLACNNGSVAMVRVILKVGGNPNAGRWTGETPVMRCAKTGSLESVKLLLAQGADVNVKEKELGQSALMWALAQRHREMAKLLVEHGADVRARSNSGFTPLMFAAQQGDMDSVKLLLSAGADVNDATPQDGNALMVAISNGQEEVSIYLLNHGANPNIVDDYGMASLHWALLKAVSMSVGVQLQPFNLHVFRPNMVETVKALLAHGANPNVRITKSPLYLTHRHNGSTPPGPVGATPFFLAALTGDVGIMRALAAAGADPKVATNEGVTPLMAAVGMGKGSYGADRLHRIQGLGPLGEPDEEHAKNPPEAVKVAVELGSDVNAKNKNGQTALHVAAKDASNAMIQFLAEKGADLNPSDKYGQTPLSLALAIVPAGIGDQGLVSRIPHKSTADLLLKLGAIPPAASAETSTPTAPRPVAAQ